MMNVSSPRRSAFKLTILTLLFLPVLAGAQQQYFTDTLAGDVDAGFRKTTPHTEADEMVVYLGNISNYLAMAAGTSTNISFYTNELAVMCPDNYGNLQWSVFASAQIKLNQYLTNSSGLWPRFTCWYTVARTNVNVQTSPANRISPSTEGNLEGHITSVSTSANTLGGTLGSTNAGNNSLLLLEPVADAGSDDNLTYFIGDSQNAALGDFGGAAIDFSVENVTSNNFTSAVVSDFYVNVPSGENDPISGSSSQFADYLGYFTLNTNGVMTFTRASAVSAPSAGTVAASTTNGFDPLTVVFSNTSSGSITNWVWNFGNGTIITNTTSGSATNTYTVAGNYTVTLTVYGPGGSSSYLAANYIVTSPTPKLGSFRVSAGKLIFSGTNCPVGVQYRILSSTNVATSNWTPVYTNTFGSNGSFSYTNGISTTNSYFIMVSP